MIDNMSDKMLSRRYFLPQLGLAQRHKFEASGENCPH